MSYNSDDSTTQEGNQYPQRDFPPAAVRQSASDSRWVNKFQQFQERTSVSRKISDKRVRNDQLHLGFSTAERRLRNLHTIDPEGHFSRGDHASSESTLAR